MRISGGTPTVTTETTGKPKLDPAQLEALKVQKSYERSLKEADRVFGELSKVAEPSVKAMARFAKVIDKLTDQYSKVEYELRINKQPGIRKLVHGSDISPSAIHQGFLESVRGQYNTRIWSQRAKEFFVSGREREDSRLSKVVNRSRQIVARMNERWLIEDTASPTDMLGPVGRTLPLAKGWQKRQGIADPIINTIAQEIAKPSSVTQRNLSKATEGLIQRITAPFSLHTWGRGTQLLKPGGATTMALDGGAATVGNLPVGLTQRMRRAGVGPTQRMTGVGPTRRMRGGGGGLASAALGGFGIYEAYRLGKRAVDALGEGADYDLSVWNQLGTLSTNAPTMDFGGAGLRGLKPRWPGAGRADSGIFGPTTSPEMLNAIYSDPDLALKLTHAGVNRADWPKLLSAYGVRGGWKGALGSSALASIDEDLRYKDAFGWAAWSGGLTARGLAGRDGSNIPRMMEAMRGGIATTGINNIPKSVFDSTVSNVLNSVSANQAIGSPTDLINYITGTMGSSQLPSLRTGAGIQSGLGAMTGAMSNVVNNPYMFKVLGDMYSRANKGSMSGTAAGWSRTLGPMASVYAPFLKDLEGTPMANQIASIGEQMTADPEKALQAFTAYYKSIFKNKAVGMRQERLMLGASGISGSDINDLLYNEWYEGKAGIGAPHTMGSAMELYSRHGGIGDVEWFNIRREMEGKGTLAKGELASTMADSMAAMSATAEEVIQKLTGLGDAAADATSKLLGMPSTGTAAPRPSSVGPTHVGPLPAHKVPPMPGLVPLHP